MPLRIEDYALIGDTHTAALVGRDGSIDWWCAPRFDSAACFAALLGGPGNGRWQIAPMNPGPSPLSTRRRYRDDTLILETEWDVDGGTVRLIDFMPIRDEHPRIVRVVEGVSGSVAMGTELVIRFDYGQLVPWLRRIDEGLLAIGGPDALLLHTPVRTRGEGLTTVGTFTVAAGERVPFVLGWYPSHEKPPARRKAMTDLAKTEKFWRAWAANDTGDRSNPWHSAVRRSLITLKALTYAPTGGIIAAPTTSLPEAIGGVRNWDYRYCWLRDATLTLYALLMSGYEEEASAWRDWLLRAVAGAPDDFQILYGAGGERRLAEYEVPWLAGYEASAPVRVGNAASAQFQLDVFGEVMDTLDTARRMGIPPEGRAWDLQQAMLDHLESVWSEPDEGIWEVRGPRRHFVHSKVMAWVAVDRALACAPPGFEAPFDRWSALRDRIHAEVLREGFDARRGTFTQYYGSGTVDASLLMIPIVGFLPANDARVVGTVATIERELMVGGLVARYQTSSTGDVDGLPAGEGAFLPCSFWLADAWALSGRTAEAEAMFTRLAGLANDVGLLSEEYDVALGRQVGNFPQAFSHLSLINTARNLSGQGSAHHRSDRP